MGWMQQSTLMGMMSSFIKHRFFPLKRGHKIHSIPEKRKRRKRLRKSVKGSQRANTR